MIRKSMIVIFAVLFCAGCTDVERSNLASYGRKHTIELYSGGECVRTWVSTGKVVTESNSDGYVFRDADGNFIRVSGNVVVTRSSK